VNRIGVRCGSDVLLHGKSGCMQDSSTANIFLTHEKRSVNLCSDVLNKEYI
jgi:hypothetical protein